MADDKYEIIIIGGGPAGLSAALAFGRLKRKTLVIDGGTPRNSAAPAIHTFLTRDGTPPKEFRKIAREQISNYKSVEFVEDIANDITGEKGNFTVLCRNSQYHAENVILAVGLVDNLPKIPGIADYWGKGIHHCIYCDGHENCSASWALLVEEPEVFNYAKILRSLAGELTVFTNGAEIPPETAEMLAAIKVKTNTAKIKSVGGDGKCFTHISMENGEVINLKTLWIRPFQAQTDLVKKLNLKLVKDGVVCAEHYETSTPGIYAAGDLMSGSAQQAILAAADGARVSIAITHHTLLTTQ